MDVLSSLLAKLNHLPHCTFFRTSHLARYLYQVAAQIMEASGIEEEEIRLQEEEELRQKRVQGAPIYSLTHAYDTIVAFRFVTCTV